MYGTLAGNDRDDLTGISHEGRLAWWIAQVGGTVICALTMHTSAIAEPCNPIVDGFYCATQMPKSATATPSRVTMNPIQDFGSAISTNQSSVATLGSISFRDDSTCIGLLRRGSCK
jgi:hypothetical protein